MLVLVPRDDQKEIEQIIGSEKLNYAPLTDQQNRIEKIWNLSEAILHEQVLDIIYQNLILNLLRGRLFCQSLFTMIIIISIWLFTS